jgi:serine/threonine protein kinase
MDRKAMPLRTVGKYQIVAKLADGAMGSVFRGEDAATGETVAIKIAGFAVVRNPVLLKRFEQEFRTASSLRHPNIVRGLEFGWTGERPYMVMELVDGEDMWSRIERLGRLTETDAVSYVTQVACGLHEAHKRGIIHRDIKPDNVLLTTDGQAKLADLGLSKDLEADMELTLPERGLGTPNFIAPEQFGDAKHAGVRCDIYSLGATLYMALTGELPFAASDLGAILKQKLANDLIPPRKVVPSLSESVDWAVRRAVLADPDRRYGSCPEFIAALSGNGKVVGPGATNKVNGSALGRGTRRSRNGGKSPVQERRSAVRFDCALPTSCTINLSVHTDATEFQTPWQAQACDLSVSGIGLLLSRRFEPGSLLTVDLVSSSGETKRTRKVRVVRVAPAEGGGWFHGGTLTEKLSTEDLRLFLVDGATGPGN